LGIHLIECWRFFSILINTAVAIFIFSVEGVGLGSPCVDLAVGGEWEVELQLDNGKASYY
jgi:hypothetical protein